jgi:uncharacterized membrane-anchored protein
MNKIANKLPEITLMFWIMKIAATTLGETAGDLFSMTMNIGYAVSSLMLISIFLLTLLTQLRAKTFHPLLYWGVILSTSTAGTTMSDFMDRTLGLGYTTGSLVLICLLVSVLGYWYWSEGSLSIAEITTPKRELLYWIAILFSNTLGTAFGDFLADSSGLGFAGGAFLVSAMIGAIVVAHYRTKLSPVVLFWLAFILTRPLGATVGDLLTKVPAKGGLGFGTIGSSLVLLTILVLLIARSLHTIKKSTLVLE